MPDVNQVSSYMQLARKRQRLFFRLTDRCLHSSKSELVPGRIAKSFETDNVITLFSCQRPADFPVLVFVAQLDHEKIVLHP